MRALFVVRMTLMLCHCVVCESLFVSVCVAGLHSLIVCSVADLLVRLFVVGRTGGCGLRETHAEFL